MEELKYTKEDLQNTKDNPKHTKDEQQNKQYSKTARNHRSSNGSHSRDYADWHNTDETFYNEPKLLLSSDTDDSGGVNMAFVNDSSNIMISRV